MNDYFDYEPFTGCLCWKKSGKLINTKDSDGYIIVGLNYKRYKAHRIIWEMHNGKIPKGMCIDHIDHDVSNNKLENLRLATDQENKKNATKQKNNKSGITGVSKDKNAGKWRADISIKGKNKYLGLFDDLNDAVAARLAAQEKYGFHVNHGKGA